MNIVYGFNRIKTWKSNIDIPKADNVNDITHHTASYRTAPYTHIQLFQERENDSIKNLLLVLWTTWNSWFCCERRLKKNTNDTKTRKSWIIFFFARLLFDFVNGVIEAGIRFQPLKHQLPLLLKINNHKSNPIKYEAHNYKCMIITHGVVCACKCGAQAHARRILNLWILMNQWTKRNEKEKKNKQNKCKHTHHEHTTSWEYIKILHFIELHCHYLACLYSICSPSLSFYTKGLLLRV